ncbi:MAG: right-handed parallel beta-helix repeat-containing protein [Thermomicrobiales bacterium]
MDATGFDDLTRAIRARLTRRTLGRVAGAGALAVAMVAPALGEAPEAEARKRRKRAGAEHNVRGKKAIMCVDGMTTRVPKRKRKHYLKRGATRGACAATPTSTTTSTPCIPACEAGLCSMDDGCGGTCGCASGSLCREAVCVACTVTCDAGTETPAVCGARLTTALQSGGTVYVCPGAYQGLFAPPVSVSIYGAGSGADPAVDTILTGQDVSGTMDVQVAGTVQMTNLRLTFGNATYGANLFVSGASLLVVMVDCVIADGSGSYGAGVYVSEGTANFQNCQFLGNTGSGNGQGLTNSAGVVTITDSHFEGNIATAGGGALATLDLTGSMTVTGCTFTKNSAVTTAYGGAVYAYFGPVTITNSTFTENDAGYGGAIYIDANGAVTLDAAVSITGNTARGAGFSGGGVFAAGGGTFNRNSATISGNTPDQCVGTGC